MAMSTWSGSSTSSSEESRITTSSASVVWSRGTPSSRFRTTHKLSSGSKTASTTTARTSRTASSSYPDNTEVWAALRKVKQSCGQQPNRLTGGGGNTLPTNTRIFHRSNEHNTGASYGLLPLPKSRLTYKN